MAGLIADFFAEDLQIKRTLTAKVNLVKQYSFFIKVIPAHFS